MADDQSHSGFSSSPPIGSTWSQSPHIYPHSHHGTPAQEYSGFSFSSPQIPMEPSAFSASIQPQQQRPMQQQLQPLIMPQWPSMLNSQSQSNYQPMYPQPVQPIQPMSTGGLQTPVSAVSSRSTSTPRKTLTDLDRKRMCQYAEEHPNSKQTEIGAIFGVERSTVSKVLRQKEKYLYQDDGSRSPVKRAKGRSPDIERALAVWAKNQEKKGLPLTDDLIRDKARAFAATTTSPDTQHPVSASWIEKFKLKNNLLGARSRKGSLAPDDADSMSAAASSSHTPNDTSPISPRALGSPSPVDLHPAKSNDSLKHESPDSYLDFASRNGPFHSQSNNSLNSAFTDTAPSSFSPGPLSPTSPFFTPDSGTAPGPFVPHIPNNARTFPLQTGGNSNNNNISSSSSNTNQQRPRSQTFPLLDQYMTGQTSSSDTQQQQHSDTNSTVLDSPMEEASDPLLSIDEAIRHQQQHQQQQQQQRPHTVSPAETMRPPPLPAHVLIEAGKQQRESSVSSVVSSSSSIFQAGVGSNTSPEEARRAMEVVLSFFEQQPHGFLDLQESVTIGKLMEKLRLQSRGT